VDKGPSDRQLHARATLRYDPPGMLVEGHYPDVARCQSANSKMAPGVELVNPCSATADSDWQRALRLAIASTFRQKRGGIVDLQSACRWSRGKRDVCRLPWAAGLRKRTR